MFIQICSPPFYLLFAQPLNVSFFFLSLCLLSINITSVLQITLFVYILEKNYFAVVIKLILIWSKTFVCIVSYWPVCRLSLYFISMRTSFTLITRFQINVPINNRLRGDCKPYPHNVKLVSF